MTFLLECLFCMEWLLLCFGEDDEEERIEHEVQLYVFLYTCV